MRCAAGHLDYVASHQLLYEGRLLHVRHVRWNGQLTLAICAHPTNTQTSAGQFLARGRPDNTRTQTPAVHVHFLREGIVYLTTHHTPPQDRS